MRNDIEQSDSSEELQDMLKKSPDSMMFSSEVKPAIAKLAESETPIPVVDSDKKLLGVITQRSILTALAD